MTRVFNFLQLFAKDNMFLTSLVRRLAIMECVVLTIGAFFGTFALALYRGMVL